MSSIYIHIPFCSSKCRYCDFFSRVVNNQHEKDRYVDAVCKEILLQEKYLASSEIKTIYFGGGTPSILPIKQIEKIFNSIYKHFIIEKDNEITLEANPEDLTEEYLNELKKHTPINRLSIGLQSFIDNELTFMNRKHSVNSSVKAVQNAKKAGFKNLTGDLIFGLPNQSLKNWQYNLQSFFDLKIPHLSAYSLTIEEGTVFGLWKKKNKISEVSDELSIKMYETLINEAEKNGYEHYEISNFAKKGYRAQHNYNYWTGKEYLGIGASAHSFDVNSRQWNVANIQQYIAQINKGKIPAEKEILSDKDKFNEFIITGLRTFDGIDFEKLIKHFSNFYPQIEKTLKSLLSEELLTLKNNKLSISDKGKFVSDSIMADLMII